MRIGSILPGTAMLACTLILNVAAQDLNLDGGDAVDVSEMLTALEDKKILFHAGFDGACDGVTEDFLVSAVGNPCKSYTNGLVGKAMIPWKYGVSYPTDDVLDRGMGTLVFWYYWPEDAKNLTQSYILPMHLACGPLSSTAYQSIWSDGKWHQWAVTWDKFAKIRHVFIDGKKIGRPVPYADMDGLLLTIGSRCPGLVDEMYIFNKVLKPADLETAIRRVNAGSPAWPEQQWPAGTESLLPVEITKLPKERPDIPSEVKWATTPYDINKCRKGMDMNGFWRFQPVGKVEDSMGNKKETAKKAGNPYLPSSDGWLYIDVEQNWRDPETTTVLNGRGIKIREYNGADIFRYPCAWYERDIEVPSGFSGNTVLLKVDAPCRDTDVYFNSRYLGIAESGMPNSFDITSMAKPGAENRIQLLSGKPYDTFREKSQLAGWTIVGVGIVDGVSLEFRSSDMVVQGEPLIAPKVREKSLLVTVPLKNNAGKDVDLAVTAIVTDPATGKVVEQPAPLHVDLKKDQATTNLFRFPAGDLTLWNPENPKMYNLALKLEVDGKLVDESLPEPFGYREIWVENGEILINGQRLSVRGCSHNYLKGYGFTPNDLATKKAAGMTGDRTLSPTPDAEKTLDYADEQGWLVFYHCGGGIPVETLLRKIGNHPSIVAWQFWGNGYVNAPHGHPMQIGVVVSDGEKKGDPSYARAEEWRKKDPTGRPIFYYRLGTGGDFRGIMTTLGFGTPIQHSEEWVSYWAKSKQDPFVPTEIQVQPLIAHEAELWMRGSEAPIAMEQCARHIGEDAYRTLTPELAEKLGPGSENCVAWTKTDLRHDHFNFVYSRILPSWRTYGINGYLFHVDFKPSIVGSAGKLNKSGKALARYNAPFMFYIAGPEEDFVINDHNFSPDETVSRSLVFINDTFHDVPCEFSWKIVDASGKTLANTTGSITVSQGKVVFSPVEFKCPTVDRRTDFTIKAEISADNGKVVQSDEFLFTIFPSPSNPAPAGRIVLVDVTGETASILDSMSVKYDLIEKPVASLPDETAMLVIGRNSYGTAVKLLKGANINAAVARGMNIVCMEQRTRYVMGLKLENIDTRYAFIRTPSPSILKGFRDTDFRDWRSESTMLPPYPHWDQQNNPDNFKYRKKGDYNSFGQRRNWRWSNKGMVATFAFEKPQCGNFRVLLETGFDMLHTPLIEFYRGKGRILFCQLDIIGRKHDDPVGMTVFSRIIEQYSALPAPDLHQLTCIKDLANQELFDLLRTDCNVAATPAGPVTYVDIDRVSPDTHRALADSVGEYVSNGGALLVSIPEPGTVVQEREKKKKALIPTMDISATEETDDLGLEDVETVLDDGPGKKAAPKPPKSEKTWFIPRPIKLEMKKVYITTPPDGVKLFDGLGLSDFFWRTNKERYRLLPGQDGMVTDSGLVGVFQHGKGRIVVIQFSPLSFEDKWPESKAIRVWNVLLTNLGIRSKVAPDFYAIGGYGVPEEWLVGYETPDVDKRPMLEESPLYSVEALDFDPNQHQVW